MPPVNDDSAFEFGHINPITRLSQVRWTLHADSPWFSEFYCWVKNLILLCLPSLGDLIFSQGFNYSLYDDDSQISTSSPDLSAEGQTHVFIYTAACWTLLGCLYGISKSAWLKEVHPLCPQSSSLSSALFLHQYHAPCCILSGNLSIVLDAFPSLHVQLVHPIRYTSRITHETIFSAFPLSLSSPGFLSRLPGEPCACSFVPFLSIFLHNQTDRTETAI